MESGTVWNNYGKTIIWLITVCMILGLTGCSAEGNGFRNFEQNGKIRVVTTIYPIYDFVQNIAGDRAEVINLVPAGTEPHDFELSTGDMRLMEQAEMLVYNGAGMEHFVPKTLKALSNEELTVVEAAVEIAPIQEEDGDLDPHTWLSISNAIRETEKIKDAFVELDGENAEFYEANFTVYKEKLEKLDTVYREELGRLPGDTIVVAHEAFGYLCQEYGLKQEAVEGLTADSEPEPAKMREIIDFCREKNIRVIFFEELDGSKVAEAIARETGAETMVLNPIEGLTAKQQEQGLDYIGLMEQNLTALKRALEVETW
ncbi:MAG: metal ABC transporter substrate-binding protein [Lachnospiraceae bacterium]|nr:metal ABC transporter substrate-binding protein [Lachnospiraceae bacterium]